MEKDRIFIHLLFCSIFSYLVDHGAWHGSSLSNPTTLQFPYENSILFIHSPGCAPEYDVFLVMCCSLHVLGTRAHCSLTKGKICPKEKRRKNWIINDFFFSVCMHACRGKWKVQVGYYISIMNIIMLARKFLMYHHHNIAKNIMISS